jgi:GNAT superfamily N-acetyltransferase
MNRKQLDAALEEFYRDIRPHPLVKQWGTWGPVVFELRLFENGVRLCWLQVLEDFARQGWAKRFMRRLCDWADRHGLELTLEVHPKGKPKVTRSALREFYARCGFIRDVRRAGGMKRLPGAMPRP